MPCYCPPRCQRLALLLSCWLIALPAWALETAALDQRQLHALGIQTQTLPTAGSARLPSLPGRVEIPAGRLQVLAAPLDGTLTEILIAPGASVKKGQVVARLISPQALELQRFHAEASARAAQTHAARQRDEQLFKEGIIAQARLENSRAAAAEAAAQLAQSRQALTLAGARPGSGGAVLELRASLDGVLLEQLAQVGERLPAATPIARIGRPAPLWIALQAPANVAARVKAGDPVRLPLLGATGKLLAVSHSVDAKSQSVSLRAEIDQGSALLRPGQAVEVEIEVGGQPGQVLPSRALARHAGQLLAFVQQGEGDSVRFIAQPVKVLAQLGDTVLVDGLAPGTRVAVQGVSSLKAMLAGVGGE